MRMMGRSQVLMRLKYKLSEWRQARGAGNENAASSVAEKVWPNLARIIAYCRRERRPLILSWANYPSTSYVWLKAKARAQRVPFADWGPAVDSVTVAIPALPMTNAHSGGHYRSWVAKLKAETLLERYGSCTIRRRVRLNIPALPLQETCQPWSADCAARRGK